MYYSIAVERERIAPVKYLTIVFDTKTLHEFENFLNSVRITAASEIHEYALNMLNSISSMKGY